MASARAGRRVQRLSAALLLAAAFAALSGLEAVFVGAWRQGTSTRRAGFALNFKAGDAVEANYGDGNWYTATIAQKNKDGTYTVKWDDAAGGPETAELQEADIKEYVPPIPLDQLVPGSKHKGKVVSVAGFGAFVNFGAERDGLVHVSCIQEGFVANINDVISEGQEVTVWVKGVQDGKISLTMVESKMQMGGRSRAPADLSPFQALVMGDPIEGKVVSVLNFGAFVEVSAGGAPAQGLVHVSEMSDEYVADPNDVVKVGQEVRVRVREVNMGTGKLSLTMKGL